MRPHRLPHSRAEKGVTLIWMAFFLVMMLMFVSLGVDMAKLMTTRTQLQNAADAAALAGAAAFRSNEGTAARDSAIQLAVAGAALNKAYQGTATPIVLNPNDVVVDTDSMTVTVTVRRDSSAGTPMLVHFLQVTGMKGLNVRASATARASGGPCDLWPVAGMPGPGQTEFTVGCTEYVLKYGGGTGSQGSYGGLDLKNQDPGCPAQHGGGSMYRDYLQLGYHCCLDSGVCIPREPGNMSGPTSQGIEDRFNRDSDQREYGNNGLPLCYTDYHGNGSRYIVVPITEPEAACGYRLLHYGKFFLTRKPGSGSRNFIFANYCGRSSGSGGPPDQNNFHVYLIR